MEQQLRSDIIQWDVISWSKALDFWESNVDWNKVTNALELGGREGGLSLWLALKGKQVVCSDVKNVKTTASALHERYGVSSFIKYEDIDATDIPYTNHFDIIVFKSIIGGIGHALGQDKQKVVFEQIHKALKRGGKLLFAENLSGSPAHRLMRNKFVKRTAYWRYISISEMKTFLESFSKYELHTNGVLGTFGLNEKQRNILSYADKLFFNHITPPGWRYIVYGVAVK